ncbi:MAG TPA: response regulator transcription factor [Thermoleophilaceae bacterium]|nr:response regulator transcription factor [Thermoleophilaceae bacterium]
MTMSSGQLRLAIVDDDSGFVRVLANRLESAGWQFRAQTSSVPPEELVAMRLNALLLDPACLGSLGWDYLARVSEALPGLGVVVCTERSTVAQRVRGLRLGADDWISKPCHPEEVVARLEAVARRRRRARAPVDAGPLVRGDLELRADQFQAFAGGRSVELTRREFEVLHLLAEAEGQVLQREDIYQRVWGYAMAHGDRSVDVFVRKLRSKIEAASPRWSYIHTHFGIGYRFQPESLEDSSGAGEERIVTLRAGGPVRDSSFGDAADAPDSPLGDGIEALPAGRP